MVCAKLEGLLKQKNLFAEMMGEKLQPDSVAYNIFIHHFCKQGKISSAFRVLKDMEKKGCHKSLETYNSLILGLGIKNQIFEIHGLMDEMKEKGISPNICTYNTAIQYLCEGEKVEDATNLLDEMMQKNIAPNVFSFKYLIEAFCKVPDFDMAQEVFETAVSICGQKEGLYSLMFNELLAAGQLLKATELLEAVLDRGFELGTFLYKDLVESLCKKDELEVASGILHKMIDRGYGFDPAALMPVIDGLGKMGNKKEANSFADKMMEMASVGEVANKVDPNARDIHQKKHNKNGGNNWQNILHRDDGSGIALRSLSRVKKGWGQGDISSFQPPRVDYLDYWEDDG